MVHNSALAGRSVVSKEALVMIRFAMLRYVFKFLIVALGLSFLGACKDKSDAPSPVALTRAANGHYCSMIIIDHPGPKAQVFEKDTAQPLWFSSVRDALAYMRLPGEAQRVVVAYVHDMSRATSWETPNNDGIWIRAESAIYVLGSSKRGGMGAREAVPFSDLNKAKNFVAEFGGRTVAFGDIPDDYILGDKGENADQAGAVAPPQFGG